MWNFDYTNADEIKSLLYQNELSMQKKFGQNFLISKNSIDKISDIVCKGVDKNDVIWEIGPGIGALSSSFVEKGFRVKAFEIDKGFANILKNKAFKQDELEVIEGDVLDTLFAQGRCPKVLAGNLPYNISTPIIANIIENKIANNLPQRMVFLLQKEVADRLASSEIAKNFSHLSFVIRLSYEPKCVLKVNRGSFFPSPNVDSALLLLEKKDEVIADSKLRKDIIKASYALFSHPRKTVYNNMRSCGIEDAQKMLSELNIDVNKRINEIPSYLIIDLCKKIIEGSKK